MKLRNWPNGSGRCRLLMKEYGLGRILGQLFLTGTGLAENLPLKSTCNSIKPEKDMKVNAFLEELRKEITPEIKKQVDMSFRIANNIYTILERREMDQKDLARLMKKNESEISKWLSGTHNFTLKTIACISEALGEDILFEEKRVDNYIVVDVREQFATFRNNNIPSKTIKAVCQSKMQQVGLWSNMPMRDVLN